MAYTVVLGPGAEREFRKLNPGIRAQIVKSLDKLSLNARPPAAEMLSQHRGFWRMRSGDYRIIYTVREQQRQVLVLVVRHRREAYRDLAILEDRLLAALAGRESIR